MKGMTRMFKVAMILWVGLAVSSRVAAQSEILGTYGAFTLAVTTDPITDDRTFTLLAHETTGGALTATLAFSCGPRSSAVLVSHPSVTTEPAWQPVTHRFDSGEPVERRWFGAGGGVMLTTAGGDDVLSFAVEAGAAGRMTVRFADALRSVHTYTLTLDGLSEGLAEMPCFN